MPAALLRAYCAHERIGGGGGGSGSSNGSGSGSGGRSGGGGGASSIGIIAPFGRQTSTNSQPHLSLAASTSTPALYVNASRVSSSRPVSASMVPPPPTAPPSRAASRPPSASTLMMMPRAAEQGALPPRPASASSIAHPMSDALSTRPASALTSRSSPRRAGLTTRAAGRRGRHEQGAASSTPPKLPQHILQLLERQETVQAHAQQQVQAQVQAQAQQRMLGGASPCGDQDLCGTAVYARYPDVRRAYLSMIETGGHGVASLLDLTAALKKQGMRPKLGAAVHAQHIGPTLHQHQHIDPRPSTSPAAAHSAALATSGSIASFADVLGTRRRQRPHPASADSTRRQHHPAAEHAQHRGDGLLWRTLHTMG